MTEKNTRAVLTRNERGTLMSSDNYMTSSALEAEYMEKKYRAARENWTIYEAAFIGFVGGGSFGAISVADRQPVLAAVTVLLAIGLAIGAAYWKRKMREWD